ncbi:MAG: tetraacyldisaccharide 4'-kinase [Bacteroidota bacterium]
MKILRILLLPFAALYGLIVSLRNKFFDWGIFHPEEFTTPIISVGNLVVGGTGKTPHIEYLIRLLKESKIATLSRGYGRKTNHFIEVLETSPAAEVGDEPRQFKQKFPEVLVCCDTRRVRGIKKINELDSGIDAILLDDAFQHRWVKPGINILLTDYSQLFIDDYMLPTGNLREPRSGALRADVIVISKSPAVFSPIDRRLILQRFKLLPHQKVFFSYLKYGEFIPYPKNENKNLGFTKEYYFDRRYSVVLFTGIANTSHLEEYLKGKVKEIIPAAFPDHHQFTIQDLEQVKKTFENITRANKLILTTEKDIMRITQPDLLEFVKKLPLFYIPVEVAFHEKDEKEFNKIIIDYVTRN